MKTCERTKKIAILIETTRIVFDNSNVLCKEINKQARIDTKAMENVESSGVLKLIPCNASYAGVLNLVQKRMHD